MFPVVVLTCLDERVEVAQAACVLSFIGGLKAFVALAPCDLRKSFNGLPGLVTERLGEDPRTGALFVFVNQ